MKQNWHVGQRGSYWKARANPGPFDSAFVFQGRNVVLPKMAMTCMNLLSGKSVSSFASWGSQASTC